MFQLASVNVNKCNVKELANHAASNVKGLTRLQVLYQLPISTYNCLFPHKFSVVFTVIVKNVWMTFF